MSSQMSKEEGAGKVSKVQDITEAAAHEEASEQAVEVV